MPSSPRMTRKPSVRKDLRRMFGEDAATKESSNSNSSSAQPTGRPEIIRRINDQKAEGLRRHRIAMQDSHHIIRMLFHDEQDVSVLETMVLMEGAKNLKRADQESFKESLDVSCEVTSAVRPRDPRARFSVNQTLLSDVATHAKSLVRKQLLYNRQSKKSTTVWSVNEDGDPQWEEDFVFRCPVRRDLRHFTIDLHFRLVDNDSILQSQELIGECIVQIPISLPDHNDDDYEVTGDSAEGHRRVTSKDQLATSPKDGQQILHTILNHDWQLSYNNHNTGAIRTSISVMYTGQIKPPGEESK